MQILNPLLYQRIFVLFFHVIRIYLQRHKNQSGFSPLNWNIEYDEETPTIDFSMSHCLSQLIAFWSYSDECDTLIYYVRPTNQNHLAPSVPPVPPWGSYYNCHPRRPLSLPRLSRDPAAPWAGLFPPKVAFRPLTASVTRNIPEWKHQQKNSLICPIQEKLD